MSVIIKKGNYPKDNVVTCKNCECIFSYYDSEIIVDCTTPDEESFFNGFGVHKWVKCPHCNSAVTLKLEFTENKKIDLISNLFEIFRNLGEKINKIFRKKKGNDNMEKIDILKVSNKSNPNSVAGAIASIVKEYGKIELYGIGAGAINQAVKSIAIARGFVAPHGINLICVPAFTDIDIEGENKTGIKFVIKGE